MVLVQSRTMGTRNLTTPSTEDSIGFDGGKVVIRLANSFCVKLNLVRISFALGSSMSNVRLGFFFFSRYN
ncbi:MAG: hypothetical protein U9O24_00600 [Campylobacterota bacterium]|nr:hypothetical protein [Campylobacterota bacterium]